MSSNGLSLVGSGLATIGLVGAGVGVGTVFGSLLVAVSRNPGIQPDSFRLAILGFALTEAVGLLALMMAFMIMYSQNNLKKNKFYIYLKFKNGKRKISRGNF